MLVRQRIIEVPDSVATRQPTSPPRLSNGCIPEALTISDDLASSPGDTMDDIRTFVDVLEALGMLDLLESSGMPTERAEESRRRLRGRAAQLVSNAEGVTHDLA